MMSYNELNEEQLKLLEQYGKEWEAVTLSTNRCDPKKTQKIIAEIYQLCGFEPAKNFTICPSPKAANSLINSLLGETDIHFNSTTLRGSLDSYWIAFYLFFEEVMNVQYSEIHHKKLQLVKQLAQECFLWWAYDTHVIVSEKPTEIHIDENFRPHSRSRPALAFEDGYQIFAINGIHVKEHIVMTPDKITISEIENESNAEIKRIMIEQYNGDDPSKYLVNSGAKEISRHEFNGRLYRLYRKEIPNIEDMVMLRCINATAEPDGTFKEFYLGIPSEITDSKEALAYTFPEETAATYNPIVET